jgi:hypothetical protein
MSWLMTSRDRVSSNTSPVQNAAIRQRTEERIEFYSRNPEFIPSRLRELDREWDIERSLETMSSSMSLLGLTLAFLRGKRWLLLPMVVQVFFLQHAVRGWCPPLPVLRRLGVRTPEEIERERRALLDLQEIKGPALQISAVET